MVYRPLCVLLYDIVGIGTCVLDVIEKSGDLKKLEIDGLIDKATRAKSKKERKDGGNYVFY